MRISDFNSQEEYESYEEAGKKYFHDSYSRGYLYHNPSLSSPGLIHLIELGEEILRVLKEKRIAETSNSNS